jgi:hypothetical protein
MDTIIYIIACPLFLMSLAGYIYARLRLRPKNSDLDEYYYEFEEQNPALARYTKWSRLTFGAIIISVLLLFIATVI